MKRFLSEAAKLIKIPSVSADGDEALVNYLSILLEEKGFRVQQQHVLHSMDGVSKRQFNIVGVLGDPLVERKIKRGLMLLAPLDTVPPAMPTSWTETGADPFNMTVKDDKVYGLGAAHSKLDLLAKIHAAQKFRDQKLKMPIYVVGACGSELGMLGAKYLLRSYSLNPKYVAVGAPSGLCLVNESKTMTSLRLLISYQNRDRDARGFNRRVFLSSHGRTSHSAAPQEGNHALMNLIGFMQRSMDSGFEVQLSKIEGGNPVGQIPDYASSEFCLTSHQFEDFKRFFRDISKALPDPNLFQVEMGGVGDVGVAFLPDTIFPCLLDVIDSLREASGALEGDYQSDYNPPTSTIVINQIRHVIGGVEVLLDARTLPEIKSERLFQVVNDRIASLSAKYSNLNLILKQDYVIPGMSSKLDDPFLASSESILRDIGLSPELKKLSITTEGGLFQSAGYDVIAFGAGDPTANVHGPNEFNDLNQLQKSIEFYRMLIERVCL